MKNNLTTLVGRILLAMIFLVAGYSKITGYAATQGYMESLGLPGAVLPLIILWEIGGGLAILLGFFTRPVALLMAAFCVISACLAHFHPEVQEQMINFMKNMAMTGGFLFVAAHGAGGWSLDERLKLKWR